MAVSPLGVLTVKVVQVIQKDLSVTVAKLELRLNGAAITNGEVPLSGPLATLKIGEEYDLLKK